MTLKSKNSCKVDSRGRALVHPEISVCIKLTLPDSDYESVLSEWRRFQTIFDIKLFDELSNRFNSLDIVLNPYEDIDIGCSLTTNTYLC